jgi:SAM-dependent methyltransferase
MPKQRDKEDSFEDDPSDDWVVLSTRPEDESDDPASYWTSDAIDRLLASKGQARIQHTIAAKTLDHLDEVAPLATRATGAPSQGAGWSGERLVSGLALDVGCGLGFSSDMLLAEGYVVAGVDIIPEMLLRTRDRDLVEPWLVAGRYHPVLASATDLPFRPGSFDLAFSVAALQWLHTTGVKSALARAVANVVSPNGRLGFHLFPKSKEDAIELGTMLKDAGFEGGIQIDNVDNPRKRRVFVVMKKVGERKVPKT